MPKLQQHVQGKELSSGRPVVVPLEVGSGWAMEGVLSEKGLPRGKKAGNRCWRLSG
jgi:hypothetical protein